uniref:Uncharacterized protein n=1 Tax=Arundo donax TaxID=35708 RepID=A0A0A9GD37_ARUDO
MQICLVLCTSCLSVSSILLLPVIF